MSSMALKLAQNTTLITSGSRFYYLKEITLMIHFRETLKNVFTRKR